MNVIELINNKQTSTLLFRPLTTFFFLNPLVPFQAKITKLDVKN